MFSRIKKVAAAARRDRGATDPILVIAGIAITLILLVGGSFAISGMITNGKNLNAKSDLDKVTVAEASYYAANDGYVAYDSTGTGTIKTDLENSANGGSGSTVGFTPSANGHVIVNVAAGGWIAASKSASGTVYYKDSVSSTIYDSSKGQSIPAADLTTTGATVPSMP